MAASANYKDGKPSMKGEWVRHVNHLNFGGHRATESLERLQVQFSRRSSHDLST